MPLNFEFKARHEDIASLEQKLLAFNPRYIGEDHQVDTYFNVPFGRLKLREGNIEHALIHYIRSNTAGAKQSDVLLYQHNPDSALKEILINALGVKAIVDKRRKIYFIENVKFHFDRVIELGEFVEVEAIDNTGTMSVESLRDQCRKYEQLFQLQEENFMAESYSDMLLAKKYSE